MQQNTEFQESTNEILLKILSGEYWLLQRQGESTVWQIYRQIIRSDGTKLKDYYFCIGCKRLLISGDTASLRSHICHVKYLQQSASSRVPVDQKASKPPGHRIHWSYRATKTLLELWQKNIEDLRGETSSKNRIYRKFAKEMNHLGLKPSDIKIKMDHLSDRYSREAERQKVTGQPSKWLHFHELQKFLNDFKENNPYRNFVNDENSYTDIETDGSIKWNDDDTDMEALVPLETYEMELDQQDQKPKQIKGATRWKAKRFMAIQEERLALKKDNFRNFQSIMKEMMSCNKNLCQVLCKNA